MRYIILLVCVLSCVAELKCFAPQDTLFYTESDSTELVERIDTLKKLSLVRSDSALREINKILPWSRGFTSPYLLACALDAKAELLRTFGDWERAIACQDSAIWIRQEHGWDKELAASWKGLGNIYISTGEMLHLEGRFDEAERYYKQALEPYGKALELYRAASNRRMVGAVLYNMGIAYSGYFKDSLALHYYRQNYSIINELNPKNHKTAFGMVTYCMALSFESLGQMDSASYYFKLAKKAYEDSQDLDGLIAVYQALALSDSVTHAQSLEYLYKADSISLVTGTNYRRANIQESLYFVESNAGNYKEALAHLEKYLELRENMITEGFQEQELKVRYQTTRQQLLIDRQKAENLRQELALQKSAAQSQRLRIISFGLALILVSGVSFFFWRRRVVRQLQEQKDQIHRQELQELEQSRNLESARAMLMGQEQERVRISEDLHDRLGSTLSAARMQLEAAAAANGSGSKFIDKGKGLIDRAIGDTREISHNLISGVLVKLGLHAALEDLKQNLEFTNQIKVNLNVSQKTLLPRQVELQLFRITQELVNNAVKHSGGDEINIELGQMADSVYLRVDDNGCGFAWEQKADGIGLSNLKRRVEAIRGRIEFHSQHNAGSHFKIVVPAINEQTKNLTGG